MSLSYHGKQQIAYYKFPLYLIGIVFADMNVCVPQAHLGVRRSEEGVRSLRTRVAGGC